LSLVLAAAIGACGQDRATEPDDTGDVALELQVSDGVRIISANYAIVGQNGFTGAGTVTVGKSTDVPVPIAGLPIAEGYNMTVVANASDGITVCRGAANFDVRANSRSTVIVHLVCREPPRTGSIQVMGALNVCPLLDGLGASPDQIFVGGTAQLSATAHDTDNAPQALTYFWTSTSGTFDDNTAPAPRFTCTAAGPATLTVVASDGDLDPSCADRLNINVICKVVP
jgi:hypothetical protein